MALCSGIESIMTSSNKLGTVGIVRPTARALPVQCWDIQRHLKVRIPVKDFGRPAAEMP